MADVDVLDPPEPPTPAEIAAALERVPAATVLAWIVRIALQTGDSWRLGELARLVRARR